MGHGTHSVLCPFFSTVAIVQLTRTTGVCSIMKGSVMIDLIIAFFKSMFGLIVKATSCITEVVVMWVSTRQSVVVKAIALWVGVTCKKGGCGRCGGVGIDCDTGIGVGESVWKKFRPLKKGMKGEKARGLADPVNTEWKLGIIARYCATAEYGREGIGIPEYEHWSDTRYDTCCTERGPPLMCVNV